MRKIVATRDYIMLKSGSLEFFVGRRYFRILKAAIREAEKVKDEKLKELKL
jgi:hypothetical protein